MGPGLFLILILLLVAELGIHGLTSWGRKLSRKVRETRSSNSQKWSERGQNVLAARWLGIQVLNRWTANCLEKSEKRGEIAVFPTAERFRSSREIGVPVAINARRTIGIAATFRSNALVYSASRKTPINVKTL